MTTKKYIGIISALLMVSSIIYIGYVLKNYHSFANEISINYNKNNKSDTLVIIFIGDSWASYHSHYDRQLKNSVESRLNKPTKVISKGTVGAKTKTIYNKMHDYSPSGTKELIELSPDYAIVSAGINDAVAKMGTENYCHHYSLIIKELISAGIKPIIIDMPQVDYRAVYQRESLTAQIRHHISSWLTEAPFWSFDEYRIALYSIITQKELKAQLIYVPASEWNPDGYADKRMLYKEDHVHLNEKGYSILDSCITSYIYQDYKTTRGFQ
jgi:lysophospholipase L1-like esterase